jgi:hypothetical protein
VVLVKITLVNNTTSEIPLTSGVPNLGRRATQSIDIGSSEFETLKPLLESLKAKNLISYSIHAAEPAATLPAPVLEHPDLKYLQADVTSSKDSLAALVSRLSSLEESLVSKVAEVENRLAVLDLSIGRINAKSPDTLVLRADAFSVVSQSQTSYSPVNGLSLDVPVSGRWVIIGEIGLYSPVSSKGKICIGRFGPNTVDSVLEGSERSWVRTQEDAVSLITTSCLSLEAGDTLSIYWKVTEGVLRATYRSLTLIRL